MKLLLTSAGVMNKSIEEAFLKLVGKPAKDIKVAFIPTAADVDDYEKSWLIKDLVKLIDMGVEVDIVDIAAIPLEMIKERIEKVDALFVEGGNDFFLMRSIKQSGFIDLIPELLKTKVWLGVSAGSIVLGIHTSGMEEGLYNEPDHYGEPFGLGLVDFDVRAHLNSEWFPDVTKEKVKELAEKTGNTYYILDDNSAIVVEDNKVEVVSEGEWEKFK